MSVTIDTGMIAIFVAVVNFALLLYTAGFRVGRLELQVNTMWDFLVKGAMTEARQRGVLQTSSPEHLNPQVAAQFVKTGLGDEIKKFYDQNGMKRMKDNEVVWELFRTFGDRLINEVCYPLRHLNVNQGDALIAALKLVREDRHA